ncbi:MAG: 16S rRNA (guanine(527)-N(7))-methyltransferase RsmG [Treponemataceae bacterium]|nr:MAG: 16S rRNA (guanine(527)-N(7))-methyltransferase RsmG [Treponemataceae bacterium]
MADFILSETMEKYRAEIELFNRAFNLVGDDTREGITNHIRDSLAALDIIRALVAQRRENGGAVPLGGKPLIADIGSGSGFPGIPLAAAMPDVAFVLVERMEKRAAFLENCAAVLHLSNVSVENSEAEHLSKGRFDLCVFRAFHPFNKQTTKLLLSLLAPSGCLVAYKGKRDKIQAELQDIASLIPPNGMCRIEKLDTSFLPEHERHLVIIST